MILNGVRTAVILRYLTQFGRFGNQLLQSSLVEGYEMYGSRY